MFSRASKGLFFSALLLAGWWIVSNAETNTGEPVQVGDSDLCVPQEYVVNLPTEEPSDGNYDTSEGFALDFIIQEEEVAKTITGYQERIQVKDQSPRSQPLYVELSPANPKTKDLDSPENFEPLEFASDLVFVDLDKKPWELRSVLEQKEDGYQQWGFCTEISQGGEQVLRCMRERLELGGVHMAYEIHQSNLHLHNEIDALLEQKATEWTCE